MGLKALDQVLEIGVKHVMPRLLTGHMQKLEQENAAMRGVISSLLEEAGGSVAFPLRHPPVAFVIDVHRGQVVVRREE